jgi:hypothetical protein
LEFKLEMSIAAAPGSISRSEVLGIQSTQGSETNGSSPLAKQLTIAPDDAAVYEAALLRLIRLSVDGAGQRRAGEADTESKSRPSKWPPRGTRIALIKRIAYMLALIASSDEKPSRPRSALQMILVGALPLLPC